jgi:hypothetical protein
MSLFRRSEIVVRCAYRGATLAVPNRDVLLDACEPSQRRRLQSCLGRHAVDAAVWSVQWVKGTGDALLPKAVIARLRSDEVIVELTYAHRATLAEIIIATGGRAAADAQLARIERRARALPTPAAPPKELVSHFVARQQRDAELIASLQHELSRRQRLVDSLSTEIAALQAARGPDFAAISDLKFKRVKTEFSKRFHPDAGVLSEGERQRRQRVFQEFWPIVEEIERS